VELFQIDVRTEPRDEVVMLRESERVTGARRARVIALAENISGRWGVVVVGGGGGCGVDLVFVFGDGGRFLSRLEKKNQNQDTIRSQCHASLAWRYKNGIFI
jgi:hypothetical protein